MDIYLLRHGKAQDRHTGITSDAGRKLTESGRAEMEAIASGIISLGIKPAVIISSPLVRATETAELVMSACKTARDRKKRFQPRYDIWQSLAPEADIRDTHALVAQMPPDSAVMLVGHEPHLSSFASSMILQGWQADGMNCNDLTDSLSSNGQSGYSRKIHNKNHAKTRAAGCGMHNNNKDDPYMPTDNAHVLMNLKKGGLVTIRGHARGQTVRGYLRSLVTPKQLRLCGRLR